ncbi:unnamed protein product [Arctia plantaginis]|uniref:Uncharacterized protein n=1 Tax=Arctia plantaginis TaxID=874455 RepID=A0A8S1BUI2_ARCPL|nr:unnamed protein product [Arctia plantaginis]
MSNVPKEVFTSNNHSNQEPPAFRNRLKIHLNLDTSSLKPNATNLNKYKCLDVNNGAGVSPRGGINLLHFIYKSAHYFGELFAPCAVLTERFHAVCTPVVY